MRRHRERQTKKSTGEEPKVIRRRKVDWIAASFHAPSKHIDAVAFSVCEDPDLSRYRFWLWREATIAKERYRFCARQTSIGFAPLRLEVDLVPN